MAEIKAVLQAQNRTFRDAVIEGLRRTLLAEEQSQPPFQLRDASFDGPVGFAPGFEPEMLTESLRRDADERMVPGSPGRWQVHDRDDRR